ncbi:GNAT family N-acetyltransferase [Amycolatopsis sp. NBC_00345]|uniref:GNAT family N-acetyltransferase n=1 Tax=Amycolatopsis sp. NBC_00345 TaxID=2975955 RepID=UPI003FA412A9
MTASGLAGGPGSAGEVGLASGLGLVTEAGLVASEPGSAAEASVAASGSRVAGGRVGGAVRAEAARGEAVSAEDFAVVRLGEADVPEMLDLVARAQPGPFLPRTVFLGTYLGIRHEGALVAMAGERLHPPGWTEISAVCTDPAFRGRGLAARLVRAVGAGIRARGETPFLHAAASNVNAIRLYESLGFRLRREMIFSALQVPGSAES